MNELIQYTFFQHALLAAVFTAISCGIVGTYIVSKRIVFISGGITHTSFGGIGIGYYLGFNPLLGAAIFSLLSALGIEFMSKKSQIREDSAIAIMWSFGMAIGIIFIYLSPGYAPNLMSYLFGSILTVTRAELYLIIIISLIIIVFFLIFYKIILFITFDPEFAQTRKIPVQTFNFLLISLVALTIVLSIKVAGIILIISLLTIPQTTANLFVREFRSIMYGSIIIALIGATGGLYLSYVMNIPSGASIIFLLVILYIIARLGRLIFRKQLK